MIFRLKVHDSLNIRGPSDVAGILRARNYESLVRQQSCRRTEKSFNLGLPVRGISAHVAEIAGKARVRWKDPVLGRIHRAIEWKRLPSAEGGFQFLQRQPACEAEIEVEKRNLFASK